MRLLSGDARRAVFAPLDDGAVRSEAVVRRLASAISLGLMADGEQLPSETTLATSLNVSTMTLRDALADLRSRGLVVTRRGRGGGSFVRLSDSALSGLSSARLKVLGTADIRELGDAHAAISGASARLAAERASNQEVGRLRDIVERLSRAERTPEQRRLDGRFFVELAASAQSVRLTMAEIEIQSEIGQIPWAPENSRARMQEIVTSHRLVVEAIVGRDGEHARSLVEHHLAARTMWLVELRLTLGGTDERAGRPGANAAHFPEKAAQ